MSCNKYGSKFLKGLRNYRVDPEVSTQVVEEYLAALDCPRALTILILFREGEHEALARMTINPLDYENSFAFRDAYAATKFLSKYEDLSLSYDLDEVAFKKFDEFELLCKQTNTHFRNLLAHPQFKGRPVWIHNGTIQKIRRILGEHVSKEEFTSTPDWGPGATTLMKRRIASAINKFQCETGITRELYSLFPMEEFERSYPLWAAQLKEAGFPHFEVGNKVVTVPKDATTNRVIAIEPGINLWFQKSLGNMIRRRLLRYGLDLRYQEVNQKLAKLGSYTGQLATVDLSSASDSVSRNVVEELLPHDWYAVLNACRSHNGVRNGKPVFWEKFSSMGNGFTFELETLIFYAVALTCCEYLHLPTSAVSVYGDDVILPSACFELFSEMMTFYGFRVNLKKSYSTTPFRESCGAHYFSGLDVKPVYFRSRLSTVPTVYRLANAIRRSAHRRNATLGCDVRLRKVFELLVQKVPKALRLRVPDGLGDGGFVSNFDEATPSLSKRLRARGFEGFTVPNLVEVPLRYYEDRVGYLLSVLWSMPERAEGHVIRTREEAIASLTLPRPSQEHNSVPRSATLRMRLANSLVSQWTDLGPWY